jgi:hypothetical protein
MLIAVCGIVPRAGATACPASALVTSCRGVRALTDLFDEFRD